MRLVPYARTSGEEEDTGQDVGAQGLRVGDDVAKAGHVALKAECDEGVSGDTDPFTRAGFKRAIERVRLGEADGLALAEVSRFTRQRPELGLAAWTRLTDSGVRVLCVADEEFNTVKAPDPADGPDEGKVLIRFVKLWKSWSELRTIRRRTTLAMADFKEGRRKTESGKPVGRPSKGLAAKELEHARYLMAKAPAGLGLSVGRAAHELSRLRGAFDTHDPKKQRDLKVGRTALAEALGLWASAPAGKSRVPEIVTGPQGNGGAGEGSLSGGSSGGSS